MLLGVARDLGELVHHTQTHCSWPSSSEKNWQGVGREVAGCGVCACVRVRACVTSTQAMPSSSSTVKKVSWLGSTARLWVDTRAIGWQGGREC